LQRARITADAIGQAQSRSPLAANNAALPTIQLPILREQDFGFFEGKSWSLRLPDVITADDPRSKPDFRDKETPEAIAQRANLFLESHLLPLLLAEQEPDQEHVVAVVSHGITLSVLWRCLLLRFGPQTVNIGPAVRHSASFTPLEYLPGWSNTGYLELEIRRLIRDPVPSVVPIPVSNNMPGAPPPEYPTLLENVATTSVPGGLIGWGIIIKTVNGKDHLMNLKRTGGGVGSAKHDERQKKIEGFFKKDPSK